MNKRPTQKDIAKRAGVSRATVSYVLSSTTKGAVPISRETRRRVLAAAEELAYQPDASAQMLRSGRTGTIGILVPDLQNPHFWQLIRGIEAAAHGSGYSLLLFHSGLSPSAESVALRELSRRRVDGVIFVASFTKSTAKETRGLRDSGRPVVDLSNRASPFDRVVSDYRGATVRLLEHLLELGHRRFGFIYGVAVTEAGLDRLEPYQRSLREAGIPDEQALVVHCGASVEDGYRAARDLLARKPRPTSIIAINDFLASAAIRAAADLGLGVPGDLSVAGFDDVPLARYFVPRLTTVHRDMDRVGEIAVKLLRERIETPDLPARTRRVPSVLEVRESTGPVSA